VVKAWKIFGQNFDLSHFRFLLVKLISTYFIMQYEYVMPWQHVGSIGSSPKEKLLPNIDGVHIVRGNSHSSPWLFLAKRLTKAWLAYMKKSTNI
jgi:hypothetical protein